MAYSLKNQEIIKEIKKTGPKPRPVSDRLWEKIDKRGEDECWPWKGANGNGTRPPTISTEGVNQIAYRVLFEISYRPIKKNEWIMHTCNDHYCMNPKHLYVGNRLDWAEKWHGIEYDANHHEVVTQRKRDRAKAMYEDNPEYKAKRKIYVQEYQVTNKIRAINYLGGVCKCGEDHPSALQFHHRDPSTKSFSITSKELSTPKKRPWDTVIIPELDKCKLLCSNCHFKHHSGLSAERVNQLKDEVDNGRI
jgi:hypothetical protein